MKYTLEHQPLKELTSYIENCLHFHSDCFQTIMQYFFEANDIQRISYDNVTFEKNEFYESCSDLYMHNVDAICSVCATLAYELVRKARGLPSMKV